MSLPKPEAIIFDWDNTLVNTWPIIHDALNSTFSEMGQPLWSIEETKARVRHSMRDSFPKVFGEDYEKASEIYVKHYRALHLDRLESLPDVVETLEEVRRLGLYSTVVSNKKGANLRTEINHIGWNHYFDKVIGSLDAEHDKPHQAPVLLAFEGSAIEPNEHVWFVGDSDIDLECAVNTGCTPILYGAGASDHPEYNDTHYLGVEYRAHVHNHTQMIDLLRQFMISAA